MTLGICRKWGIYIQPEIIKDIVNMAIATCLIKFDPKMGKIESWLYWSLLEGCRVHVRKEVKNQILMEKLEESPRFYVMNEWERDFLEKGFRKLNDKERRILLGLFKGEELKDVCKEMGISYSFGIKIKNGLRDVFV